VRELHVVAVSEDGRHVVLAGKRGATTGGYRVALDDRLAAAVRGDLPRPGEDSHAAPDLSPKEIQARLRSGESAESIALSAGVPVTRVERFAGPVEGEMARMIDAARSSYLVRGRLGRSAVPLGKAVDAVLAQAPTLRPDSVEWSTHRLDDGVWLVTVSWFARKRTRTASWRYDPAAKALASVDPQSAALGFLDPEAPATPPKRRAAAPAKAPARKAPAKKAPAKRAAAKKAPVKKAPAKKAAPAKPVAKKAPAKKAPVARKAAPAAARRTPPPPRRTLRVVPDPEPQRKAAERDGVKSRASVPAWADVLLGTSPGGER
jgi:hypothetical protein